jgi:hypothetical protein
MDIKNIWNKIMKIRLRTPSILKNIFSKKITYAVMAAFSVFAVSLKIVMISNARNHNNNTLSGTVVSKNIPSITSTKYSAMQISNEEPAMGYVKMSQPDIDKINEIVNAVSEDDESASQTIKQEVADLFAKYNMTSEDKDFFKMVGPGFIVSRYDVFFFKDALESLKEGKTVKSEARKNLEDLGLTYGTLTSDFINYEDQEIEKISKNEPAMRSPATLTEIDIKGLLNYAITRASRVDALLEE